MARPGIPGLGVEEIARLETILPRPAPQQQRGLPSPPDREVSPGTDRRAAKDQALSRCDRQALRQGKGPRRTPLALDRRRHRGPGQGERQGGPRLIHHSKEGQLHHCTAGRVPQQGIRQRGRIAVERTARWDAPFAISGPATVLDRGRDAGIDDDEAHEAIAIPIPIRGNS
jgi:hypothetical protein